MKRKAIVLFLALAALLALPTTTLAQNWDGGLFRNQTNEKNSNGLMNRTGDPVNVTGSISNYGYGEPAPLGSGVLIMLLAGAGYVALKKKED